MAEVLICGKMNSMGWKEYCRERKVLSFEDQVEAYRKAIEFLSPLPDRSMNFALGGFYPYGSTPGAFRNFCPSIHQICFLS